MTTRAEVLEALPYTLRLLMLGGTRRTGFHPSSSRHIRTKGGGPIGSPG